jgi:hypothetical protein
MATASTWERLSLLAPCMHVHSFRALHAARFNQLIQTRWSLGPIYASHSYLYIRRIIILRVCMHMRVSVRQGVGPVLESPRPMYALADAHG